MQAMAARTFGALKIAIEKINELYSQSIPFLKPNDSFLECPYPRSYTDWTDHIHAFSYDVIQPLNGRRLIFFGGNWQWCSSEEDMYQVRQALLARGAQVLR